MHLVNRKPSAAENSTATINQNPKTVESVMRIKNLEFDNVHYRIDKAFHQFEELSECEYVGNIILELHKLMGAAFYNYDFIIYSQANYRKGASVIKPRFPQVNNKKQIVLYISDELAFVPDEMATQVFAVFKQRLPSNLVRRNIFPFPTGYNKTTKHLEVTPINKRKYNVFFFGQLSSQRIELYKSLVKLSWIPYLLLTPCKTVLKKIKTNFDSVFPDSFIRFTSGFQQGYGPEHYASTLYNSKIAICPYGNINYETFRHFEAMRAGCIVITKPMPDVFFFKNAPVIELNNWSELKTVVHDLLQDEALMDSLHKKALEWWHTRCNEQATAAYIASTISALELEEQKLHEKSIAHVQ